MPVEAGDQTEACHNDQRFARVGDRAEERRARAASLGATPIRRHDRLPTMAG